MHELSICLAACPPVPIIHMLFECPAWWSQAEEFRSSETLLPAAYSADMQLHSVLPEQVNSPVQMFAHVHMLEP